MSNDARVEAAISAVQNETYGAEYAADLAGIALEAADAADRAAEIVRVRVDDETVERVARALVRHRWPTALGDVWGSLGQGTQDDTLDQARAVLTALRGES